MSFDALEQNDWVLRQRGKWDIVTLDGKPLSQGQPMPYVYLYNLFNTKLFVEKRPLEEIDERAIFYASDVWAYINFSEENDYDGFDTFVLENGLIRLIEHPDFFDATSVFEGQHPICYNYYSGDVSSFGRLNCSLVDCSIRSIDKEIKMHPYILSFHHWKGLIKIFNNPKQYIEKIEVSTNAEKYNGIDRETGLPYWKAIYEAEQQGKYWRVEELTKSRDEARERLLSILQRELKDIGFPYEKTKDEYIRYNDTLNTVYLHQDKENNMHKITWRALRNMFMYMPYDGEEFVKKHTYIVGQSGSGKSELLKVIVNNLYGHVVLIDPHGELFDDLQYICMKYWDQFFNLKDGYFAINPFDIEDKSPENRELVAQEISDLLGELMEDSNLSRLMKTIAFPIVYTLLKAEYADLLTFAEVIHPSEGLARLEALQGLVEPQHRTIWADLMNDTYDTTKRSIYNRLQSLLNYQTITDVMCKKDQFRSFFNPEQVRTFFSLGGLGSDVAKTLGRVLMTSFQIWAKTRGMAKNRYYENGEKKYMKDMYLIVDEFQNFLSSGIAKTLDEYGRKNGLFLILAHQHLSQIQDTEIKGAIMSATKNKIIGNVNASTAQAMLREIGELPEPHNLQTLKTGHFACSFEGKKPFVAYFKRIKPNPTPIKTKMLNKPAERIDIWEQYRPKPAPASNNTSGNRKRGGFSLRGDGDEPPARNHRQDTSSSTPQEPIKPKFDL